jgi:hypothetical protein
VEVVVTTALVVLEAGAEEVAVVTVVCVVDVATAVDVVVVVVVVAFVVVVAELQDASRIAATNTKDKPNQINLCFTVYLPFSFLR